MVICAFVIYLFLYSVLLYQKQKLVVEVEQCQL